MKKLLLALMLMTSSLHNPIEAHVPRKKSKEAAFIKASLGTYFTITTGFTAMNNLANIILDTDERPLYCTNAMLSFCLCLVLASAAKQGMDDLEEIAQNE